MCLFFASPWRSAERGEVPVLSGEQVVCLAGKRVDVFSGEIGGLVGEEVIFRPNSPKPLTIAYNLMVSHSKKKKKKKVCVIIEVSFRLSDEFSHVFGRWRS